MNPVRNVEVNAVPIRLGQFLKLAGLVDGGGDVKGLLEAGAVTLNGRPESRRGAQLKAGDVVTIGAERVRVSAPSVE